MATVPLSGTNIRFLSGVPFANDYKNSRWFDNLTSQTNYFIGKPVVHSMDEANFQRIEGVHFVAVNKSIDELWGTNYLMFQNAQYNNKWFYAFVTKLQYVQKKTTYIHFQIDVLQTWKFTMNFKPSFTIREHCKLWNADGSPVINTIDEGLNYGTDYDVKKIIDYKPYGDIVFLVIVAKSRFDDGFENQISPVYNGMPQPLTYYVHPINIGDGIYSTPQVTINGISAPITPSLGTLQRIFTQTGAVNNIVSLYVTDFIGTHCSYNNVTDTMAFNGDNFERVASYDEAQSTTLYTLRVKELKRYGSISSMFFDKYSDYDVVTESKLLMHPYTTLIMDDFKGNRTILKNEYINSDQIKVRVKGSMGTSNKVSYNVENYLLDSTQENANIAELENASINNTPNDLPIISDYLSAYLQGNKNSIDTQKEATLFNGVMGAIGGAIGGVASAGGANPIGVAGAGVGIVQGAGNTVYQLQAIESKLKDVNNVPPSLFKMGGNASFDYGQGVRGVFLIKKQIKPEYLKKLEDFFNMFGYKVNEVKTPNFHTRQHWNYIQTASCNILGNFNNEDLQELKNVFDNGITFWHTDDIGNYSLANGVL